MRTKQQKKNPKKNLKVTSIAVYPADKKVFDEQPRLRQVTNPDFFHELLVAAGWIK